MKVRSTVFLLACALALLAGAGLRALGLADVPPRWDEGWSVAHASLPLAELFRITAADVHPPLYYMILGAWQNLVGENIFVARYLSLLLSITAIPLTFVAARAWSGSRRVGLMAAALMAWLPLAQYYGGVVRMYALAPSFVMLAVYGGVKGLRIGSRPNPQLLLVIGSLGAMLTLYHAAWALLALGVFVLLVAASAAARAKNWRGLWRFILAVLVALVLYLPWALYALPQFFARAAAEAGTNIGQQLSLAYFASIALRDLTFSQNIGWVGVGLMAAIVALGLVMRLMSGQIAQSGLTTLLLPVLIIAFTIGGVAYAARNWAFNARMVICAAPAIAMLLAWGLDGILGRARFIVNEESCGVPASNLRPLLAGMMAILLGAAYLAQTFGAVPQKTLEVFDPYNPNTYAEHLSKTGRPDDIAFFNVLSPAGFYAMRHPANAPAWSYALTWDPVIEPPELWQERIAGTSASRVWLALYRGLAGKNGELRGWMDSHFYPAFSEWGEEDVFYGLYGKPPQTWQMAALNGAAWDDFELSNAKFSASAKPGDVIAVELHWLARAAQTRSLKVFVHALAADGHLVAGHDAMPLNDLRPLPTLPAGEDVRDNHGLALPPNFRGEVRLIVGLYNPNTGQRAIAQNGKDFVELGIIQIEPK